jgi:hypothetical protein
MVGVSRVTGEGGKGTSCGEGDCSNGSSGMRAGTGLRFWGVKLLRFDNFSCIGEEDADEGSGIFTGGKIKS